MIKINTCHIQDEPLEVAGTEPSVLLDLTDVATPEKNIHYQLFASMAGKDLVVRGKAWVKIKAECARCLAGVDFLLQAPDLCLVRENVPEQEVNVTDEIREELLLALPRRFLCKEDCKGLCPHCGCDWNRKSCSCAKKAAKKEEIPPEQSPWAILDQLKK